MAFHPAMPQAHMVGHEVQHQPQAAGLQSLSEPRQCDISAQSPVDRIVRDGEPRAENVLVRQVGQGFLEFPLPLGVAPRDFPAGRARLPDAEQPNPIEAQRGHAVQLGVGNVVQGGRAADVFRQLGHPDASVDLVKRRIARC